MPDKTEIPTHLNIRIDAKVRYLTELAARARNESLTEYVENALKESFKKVSVDEFSELSEEPDVYELSPAQRQEKFRKRQEEVRHPLSDVADHLWADHPIVRIQLLALSGLNHLMREEDKHVWDYIFARYKGTDGRLDLKRIEKDWAKIRFTALLRMKKAREKDSE